MSPGLPAAVEAALTRQAEALGKRVRESGLYTHEIGEFRVARRVHRWIAPALGLTDLGTLTTPESRNIVRKVCQPDGSVAVLKVIGNLREPGEGDALHAWSTHSLPCVRPLRWSEVPAGADGGSPVASYLLTEHIDRPVLAVPDAAPLTERQMITRRLTECVSQFHAAELPVPECARSWTARVGVHLHWTLPLVRRAGLAEPANWADKLTKASARGNVLLHGDAAGANVLVLGDGSLVLLDPPGAIRGPREADIGHIVSYVACVGSSTAEAKVSSIEPLLRVACDAAPWLDPAAVALFAGMDLITWAGYFLAGHANRNAGSSAGGHGGPAPLRQAQVYLAGAERLLAGTDYG
ncbi:MAG: phosphotransferase [Streptosporangiaceae bacterium]